MSESRECPGRHTVEHPAPALRADEYLCRSCVRHAERVLADLPSLVRDLETTVTRQTRTYRASARGAQSPDEDWRGSAHALPATPLPVDLTASERGRTVCELLFEWTDYLATWHGVKGMPIYARYMPLTQLVPSAVGVLLRFADWMRSNEQGPDLANAVQCIRRDLRAIVDCRPERLYAGPCDADLGYAPELGYRCQQHLYRQWGHDEIACDGHRQQPRAGRWYSSGCGTIHTSQQRREWLRADVESRLLPLRLVWESLYELVPGCDVDWQTAKQWTRERQQRIPRLDENGKVRRDKNGREMVDLRTIPPRLEPQSWDSNDTPLYRGSDVLRLAEDKPVRRGRRRVRRATVA